MNGKCETIAAFREDDVAIYRANGNLYIVNARSHGGESTFPKIKRAFIGKTKDFYERPVTVVEFSDGTKTKVTLSSEEYFFDDDPEKAILYAIAKRVYGTGPDGFHSQIKRAMESAGLK